MLQNNEHKLTEFRPNCILKILDTTCTRSE